MYVLPHKEEEGNGSSYAHESIKLWDTVIPKVSEKYFYIQHN